MSIDTPFKLLALNVMIGGNIDESLEQHRQCGLRYLDLKMDFCGAPIEDSDRATVQQIAQAAAQRGLETYCLSSCLGNCSISDDDTYLQEQYTGVKRLISFIPILNPRCVRLIMPRGDAAVIHDERILSAYRDWCQQLLAAGVEVVIENEIGNSIGRDPQLIMSFLENLGIGNKVRYIWDIANQWQEGRFPSTADYHILRPVIGIIHVKGGRWNNPQEKTYAWKSMLDNSDWPVTELCALAIENNVPAICINPPHGTAPENWSYDLNSDISFLQNLTITQ